MKEKTNWTPDQLQALIDASIDLRNSDPEPSLLQIIKMAQEIIFEPKDRKYIKSVVHVKEVISGIKERFGVPIKPVKYVDKYAELEERVSLLEKALKIKPRLKIAIAGLKGNQYNEIKKCFGEAVTLSFIDREQAKASFPTSANFAIVATDFISHSFTNQMKNYYEKGQIVEVEGGIDSIKDKIQYLIQLNN